MKNLFLSIFAFLCVACGLLLLIAGKPLWSVWTLVFIGLLSGLLPILKVWKEAKILKSPSSPPAFIKFEKATPLPRLNIEIFSNHGPHSETKKTQEEEKPSARSPSDLPPKSFHEFSKDPPSKKKIQFHTNTEETKNKRHVSQSFDSNYFKQERFQYHAVIKEPPPAYPIVFFKGVEKEEDLRKRYRELLKIYHPDNQSGDQELTQSIQKEYEYLQSYFSSHHSSSPQ